MCQYIDVKKLVNALPEKNECSFYSTNHYYHPEISVELPICVSNEESFEAVQTKKVQTCTILYNLPDSHYVNFNGFRFNTGVYSLSGVIRNNFCGFFYASVHNSCAHSQVIPSGTCSGSLSIKKYYDINER